MAGRDEPPRLRGVPVLSGAVVSQSVSPGERGLLRPASANVHVRPKEEDQRAASIRAQVACLGRGGRCEWKVVC